jgi:hypothetical protein
MVELGEDHSNSIAIPRVLLLELVEHHSLLGSDVEKIDRADYDAVRRGVSERALQTFLGHTDVRSTRRYARLSAAALVSVLRPPDVAPSSDDLSRTCPAGELASRNRSISQDKRASPTGFEPGEKRRKSAKRKRSRR